MVHDDHAYLTAHEIDCHRRQPIVLALSPKVFDPVSLKRRRSATIRASSMSGRGSRRE
jgi:hypothetical protein